MISYSASSRLSLSSANLLYYPVVLPWTWFLHLAAVIGVEEGDKVLVGSIQQSHPSVANPTRVSLTQRTDTARYHSPLAKLPWQISPLFSGYIIEKLIRNSRPYLA